LASVHEKQLGIATSARGPGLPGRGRLEDEIA
jgi:hypothetical protein